MSERKAVKNRVHGRRTRRRGRRWLSWLKAAGAVLAGVGLTVGAVEACRWAKTTPMFAMATIEVVGAERARAEDLVRLSGIAVGMNLFDVDVDSARRGVAQHPWVAKANVRLVAIDQVRISVVEHRPVAVVALQNLYFADAAGRLFKRYTPGESVDLPVVTGLDRAAVEADDPRQVALLGSALELIAEWDDDAHGRLAEVHVHEALGLTATVGDGLAVALGSDWRRRLPGLVRVRRALRSRGLRARRIDLSGDRLGRDGRAERAIVRLAPEDAEHGDV